jgi:hypothetical protein
MAGLSVKTAATAEALTEIQIRDYLRVDQDSELGVLRLLRRSAREFCESYTGRVLLSQTLELHLDATGEIDDPLWEGIVTGPYLNYYKNFITLPSTPVASVSSVTTYDDSDNATVMAASKYYVDTIRQPARITLRTGETWPSAMRVANAIKVEFVAGYANGQIPTSLQMGMLQHIAYMYDQRGDMKDPQQTASLPPMVAKLYQPHKVLDGFGGSKFMALG